MPYRTAYDPADARTRLLGNFIGANLGAQFEAMVPDWLNLGKMRGSPESNDPLLGTNDPATSWFDLHRIRRNQSGCGASRCPDTGRRLGLLRASPQSVIWNRDQLRPSAPIL